MLLDPRTLNRVLCIYVYGSSGTYLLHSLLDNHPEVLAMPIPMFNYYYDFWDRNEGVAKDKLMSAFFTEMGVLFDSDYKRTPDDIPTQGEKHSLDRLGPNKNEKLFVDKGKFAERMDFHLAKYPVPTRKHFFQAIHVAYAEALDRTISTIDPLIVYQLHWPLRSRTLKVYSDFPNAQYIHMIREPAPSMASLYNGLALGAGFDSMRFGARCIEAVLEGAGPVIPEIASLSRSIRLEDLHASSKEIMQKLSIWLGISWSPTLLESTFNGKKWWSYPSRKGDLNGFSKNRLKDDNREVMSKLDEFVIQALLYDRYSEWGYFRQSRLKSIAFWVAAFPFLFIPFRMELHAWRNAKNREPFLTVLKLLLHVRLFSITVWLRRAYLPVRSVSLFVTKSARKLIRTGERAIPLL
jgi:hypothetical protein